MRLKLGHDLRRLAPRQPVEAREHRFPVPSGHDLRGLDDRGEADLPLSQRLRDGGDLLDQLGRDLPVLGRAEREVQPAVAGAFIRARQHGPNHYGLRARRERLCHIARLTDATIGNDGNIPRGL